MLPATIAEDGESLRGTFSRAGAHLLAASTHDDAVVLVQLQVRVEATEITWLPPLPDPIDLAGKVVMADALPVTADHARYLHSRAAASVFTVKGNQHRLHGLLDTPPWRQIPAHSTDNRWHSRSERRVTAGHANRSVPGLPHDRLPARRASRARTGSAPRVTAGSRDLDTSASRKAGHATIAAALRHLTDTPPEPSPCPESTTEHHQDFAGTLFREGG
ncbi:hypothetical protein AB0F91_38670 [Amycolatopsis sp. NPDC023774]|uniref:hypothetical protein n=1 Tax=Amycolatopsis sp. NPDC023774 TaxID=3155015 RepID=UPI0033E77B46